MSRYRSKPVDVDAHQWDGSAAGAGPILVDGGIHGWADSIDTAIDAMARAHPPDDTELAALLTWAACGKTRT